MPFERYRRILQTQLDHVSGICYYQIIHEFEEAESPLPDSVDRIQHRDSGGSGFAVDSATAELAITSGSPP